MRENWILRIFGKFVRTRINTRFILPFWSWRFRRPTGKIRPALFDFVVRTAEDKPESMFRNVHIYLSQHSKPTTFFASTRNRILLHFTIFQEIEYLKETLRAFGVECVKSDAYLYFLWQVLLWENIRRFWTIEEEEYNRDPKRCHAQKCFAENFVHFH